MWREIESWGVEIECYRVEIEHPQTDFLGYYRVEIEHQGVEKE